VLFLLEGLRGSGSVPDQALLLQVVVDATGGPVLLPLLEVVVVPVADGDDSRVSFTRNSTISSLTSTS
jgi:hypothetical protein